MTDCLFCKIIKGDIPSKKIYEDDKLIAFKDIHPVAPTHILFVPKKHYATLNDIPAGDTIMSDITAAIQKIAKEMGISENGYRVVTNVNKEGGQVIFHLHTHLLGGRPLSGGMG